MSKGYIFVLVECKRKAVLLVTHSARLAMNYLIPGRRVDVWLTNRLYRKIYSSDKFKLLTYVKEEVGTVDNNSPVEEKTQ